MKNGLVDAKLWRDLSMPPDKQWTLEWRLIDESYNHQKRFETRQQVMAAARQLGWKVGAH